MQDIENKTIGELIGEIRNEVKKEYEKRYRDLELENAKLLREIELAKKSGVSKTSIVRDFLLESSTEAFAICAESRYVSEKCGRCGDDRRIHFKTPTGQCVYEMCPCSRKMKYFYYEPYTIRGIDIDGRGVEISEVEYRNQRTGYRIIVHPQRDVFYAFTDRYMKDKAVINVLFSEQEATDYCRRMNDEEAERVKKTPFRFSKIYKEKNDEDDEGTEDE